MDFTVRIVSRKLANTLNSKIVRISRFLRHRVSGVVKRVRETCDVTKVTYYMYSCDTCCMSRGMMEMDGLDSVKCQNSEKKGHDGNY